MNYARLERLPKSMKKTKISDLEERIKFLERRIISLKEYFSGAERAHWNAIEKLQEQQVKNTRALRQMVVDPNKLWESQAPQKEEDKDGVE